MLVQVTLSTILFLQMLHRSSEISLKSSTSKPPQSNNHQNISNLLDNLLSGYDNSVRPDFGGKYVLTGTTRKHQMAQLTYLYY